MELMLTNLPYRLAKACFRETYLLLSDIGARLGWDWLTYNYLFYLALARREKKDAPVIADALLRAFPGTKSLCDVGCGPGFHAVEFQRRGLSVVACEYTASYRRRAAKNGLQVFPFDVSKSNPPLQGSPFDIAISFEVAEHIPAAFADGFVDFTCRTSDRVILTAAHPGQGGQGHVNEQPQSYWIEKFQARGFRHDLNRSRQIAQDLKAGDAASYLSENMMVFERQE